MNLLFSILSVRHLILIFMYSLSISTLNIISHFMQFIILLICICVNSLDSLRVYSNRIFSISFCFILSHIQIWKLITWIFGILNSKMMTLFLQIIQAIFIKNQLKENSLMIFSYASKFMLIFIYLNFKNKLIFWIF